MYFDQLGKMKDVKVKSGSTSPDNFKNSATMTYPKVKKGSTQSKNETSQGGIEITYNYTLNNITDKIVVLDVTGSLDGSVKRDVKEQIYIEIQEPCLSQM